MNEAKIINILTHWTDDRKFPWQLANSFIYKWECDFWTMTSYGETREFEIKISRSDFLIDAKKDKHAATNGANYFYYVCPNDLIRKNEIDNRYGLIYVYDDERLIIIKKPRKLHYSKFDRWEILANKMYWKFRALWREKLVDKVITHDEYWEGFKIEIFEEESSL